MGIYEKTVIWSEIYDLQRASGRASVYIDYDSMNSYKGVTGYQVAKWADEGLHGGMEVDHKPHVWQDTMGMTVNNGELLKFALEYLKSHRISVRT